MFHVKHSHCVLPDNIPGERVDGLHKVTKHGFIEAIKLKC